MSWIRTGPVVQHHALHQGLLRQAGDREKGMKSALGGLAQPGRPRLPPSP